jgi:hypothetical protein
VNISGRGFLAGAVVTLGGVTTTETVVLGAGALVTRTPAHADGAVELVVTNPNGASGTLPAAYVYRASVPPVQSSGTFAFADVLGYPVSGFTRQSRYVLNADGTFALEYVGLQPYRGRYTIEGGIVQFEFDSGGYGGTGAFTNHDTLEIRYTSNMQSSDFDNAIYRRSN